MKNVFLLMMRMYDMYYMTLLMPGREYEPDYRGSTTLRGPRTTPCLSRTSTAATGEGGGECEPDYRGKHSPEA